MNLNIDRRLLLKAGTFGLLALPTAGIAQLTMAKGFTHGVASGEPSASSILVWTRYVGSGDAKLTAEISDRVDFSRIIGGSDVVASEERDHIAKTTISGLAPGRWYFYRFIAPDGSVSQIGRTRTLPDAETAKFNMAVFSCSNLPFGYFNAYAHACERSDIDLVLHLGDYLYEYQAGNYPARNEWLEQRKIDPANEIVTLSDYRLRYAAYRQDPDLQRLHQIYPMIAQWDDHEITNDAWKDGAQNHQPDTEGDYATRRTVAERVYREWMPVADVLTETGRYGSYQIGNLATIFKTESRITGRDEQLDLDAAIAGQADVPAALMRFRDDVWQNPARSMLGRPQEDWLAAGFAASTRAGTKWQLWAQQCIMGNFNLPLEAEKWIPDSVPDYVKNRVRRGVLASQVGLPANLDAWDGYPAARSRSLKAALAADADLVVLTGDSHNGWAFDLTEDGVSAGVDFAGHSVTSPGLESYTKGVDPAELSRELRVRNPGLKYSDTSRRGYITIAMTPERVTSTWHYMATIREKSVALAGEDVRSVVRGARKITEG